jgi:hypothetical protein
MQQWLQVPRRYLRQYLLLPASPVHPALSSSKQQPAEQQQQQQASTGHDWCCLRPDFLLG